MSSAIIVLPSPLPPLEQGVLAAVAELEFGEALDERAFDLREIPGREGTGHTCDYIVCDISTIAAHLAKRRLRRCTS